MTGKRQDDGSYHRTQMQKELVIQKLREKGCRITKQRLMLLDIILEEDCSCCKEIYYRAVKKDARIGTATVYRMVNTLEEIGAISRKNMYKVTCGDDCQRCGIRRWNLLSPVRSEVEQGHESRIGDLRISQ